MTRSVVEQDALEEKKKKKRKVKRSKPRSGVLKTVKALVAKVIHFTTGLRAVAGSRLVGKTMENHVQSNPARKLNLIVGIPMIALS